MNLQATDPRMIEALESATSLQLYQLKALIERMLADPRRGIAARVRLHLGPPVQFVDFRDGQMRRGKIIAQVRRERAASTNAPPRSAPTPTPPMREPGACRSICCAPC